MLFLRPMIMSLACSRSLLISILSAGLASAASPATTFPVLPRQANLTKTGFRPTSTTKKYFANAFCTVEQKIIEQVAWEDALLFAQALASWQINGSFQPAMDLYMGTGSRGPLSAVLEGAAQERG